MKKKLMMVVPLLLVLAGAGYTMTKPKPVIKTKIKGRSTSFRKSFLDNLSDGHYAKFSVALLLAPGQSDGASADGGNSSSANDGTTLGTLPEEALIRSIITDQVTGLTSASIDNPALRGRMLKKILQQILAQTDVKVTAVLLPDLAVQ